MRIYMALTLESSRSPISDEMLSSGRWTDDVTTLSLTSELDGGHVVSVEAEVDLMHVDLIRTRAYREDAPESGRIALFPGAKFELVTIHETRTAVPA